MLAILAALMLAAAPQSDTVFTADGGRVVGTVVEEGAQGVTVQLPDGTYRRLARRDVVRIEYADGSVSTPRDEPPPAASSAPPPPPRYTPPPPPQYAPPPRYVPPPPGAYPARPPPPAVRPWPGQPISPLYLSFGLGGLFPFGEAEDDLDMRDVFGDQFGISLEGGLRLNPHLAVGLYADLGWGDVASEQEAICRASGVDCSSYSGRIGVLLRHTFAPAARTTPWISIGTGYEVGKVYWDVGGFDDEFSYRGWEVLRLMGGVDVRSSPVFGVGFYGGVAFGRFSRFEDATGDFDTFGNPFHTTIQAGLRFTLFP